MTERGQHVLHLNRSTPATSFLVFGDTYPTHGATTKHFGSYGTELGRTLWKRQKGTRKRF